MSRGRIAQSGFSLVEVILAMGLLGGVMISISSMFILGGREVQSGKQTTVALAVAQDIVEEIKTLTFRSTYSFFGGTDTSSSLQSDSSSPGDPADKWQPNIDLKCNQGRALIDVIPVGGPDTPPEMGSADFLRVRVTVEWSEGTRERSLSLQTLRF